MKQTDRKQHERKIGEEEEEEKELSNIHRKIFSGPTRNAREKGINLC